MRKRETSRTTQGWIDVNYTLYVIYYVLTIDGFAVNYSGEVSRKNRFGRENYEFKT